MQRRIAFISEHASPLALLGGVDSGGQNVYVARVAENLAKQGYLVDVFTRWDNEELSQVIEYMPGVRVVHVEAGPRQFVPKEKLFEHMDEFASGMIAMMEKFSFRYDLIHAHFWMSGYVAVFLKNVLNVPFVITFHALGRVRRIYQGDNDGFPDERFRVEEMVAREADIILAECPQDREDLMIHYMVDPEKIEIIPCGFDPSEFHPVNKLMARLKLGLDPSKKVILQLGRMVRRKGVDNVIKGLACLIQKGLTDVNLLIVGGETDDPDPARTPEIGRLMNIAREEKLDDRIIFTGRKKREELKLYYNAANVFVSTPWYEPFGITPLEAMACGTPVVGANVGGIKYSVEHGKTGYLVPPNEPKILAERLSDILSKPDRLEWMASNCMKRVHEFFTWEKVSAMIAKTYDKVLERKNPVLQRIQMSLTEIRNRFKRNEVELLE